MARKNNIICITHHAIYHYKQSLVLFPSIASPFFDCKQLKVLLLIFIRKYRYAGHKLTVEFLRGPYLQETPCQVFWPEVEGLVGEF